MPEASRDDSAMQRERLHREMREALLDGTDRARVALLTGLSPERVDELGGTGE
jgi:hypothetical protein